MSVFLQVTSTPHISSSTTGVRRANAHRRITLAAIPHCGISFLVGFRNLPNNSKQTSKQTLIVAPVPSALQLTTIDSLFELPWCLNLRLPDRHATLQTTKENHSRTTSKIAVLQLNTLLPLAPFISNLSLFSGRILLRLPRLLVMNCRSDTS